MIKNVIRRRRTALAMAGAAVAASAVLGASPVQAATNVTYEIRSNSRPSLCVSTDPSAPDANSVQLLLEPCDGNLPQHWTEIDSGRRTRLQNAKSLGCMDAHGPYLDFTPVDTWPCNGISNEKWGFHISGDNGIRQLLASGGNRCLDVAGGALQSGGQLVIFRCNPADPAQLFDLVRV